MQFAAIVGAVLVATLALIASGRASGGEVSEPMIQALRTAKTASVTAKETFANASGTVGFEDAVKELVEFAGWRVVDGSAPADVAIEVVARVEALPMTVEIHQVRHVKYLGVRASGQVAWRVQGVGEHVERFWTTVDPRSNLDFLRSGDPFPQESYSRPGSAPFHLILSNHESGVTLRSKEGQEAQTLIQRPFVLAMAGTMGQVLGKHFLFDLSRKDMYAQFGRAAHRIIFNDPAYIEILLERARHENARERHMAVSSMALRSDPRIVGAASALLVDPDPEVRITAAFTLRDHDAVEHVIDALDGAGHVEALKVLKVFARGMDHGRDKAAWRMWWAEQPRRSNK